ncbi:MAG: bifunctional (p)ppGpp synthetase/guanosine-3',5'-bis(diphosphate) 3'-pyrophosphohydrolase [Candidatus Pacebacteria bacterium]|nr:bifunctional (p)ppGpp synthetase/guanosine-3',5'-bis(diphosphate) 3'-pyrophosphohydrolase [Candidatus Paceibacterota bacterium]
MYPHTRHGNVRINKAITFAASAHGDQVRKGNLHVPYVFHPIDVADEVIRYSGLRDRELEIATVIAILHDTVEDTPATLSDILDQFDEVIMKGVEFLTHTHVSNRGIVSKDHDLHQNLMRLQLAPDYVQVVKLADRISNLKVFPAFWSLEKIKTYLDSSSLIAKKLGDASEDLHARLLSRVSEMRTTLSILSE